MMTTQIRLAHFFLIGPRLLHCGPRWFNLRVVRSAQLLKTQDGGNGSADSLAAPVARHGAAVQIHSAHGGNGNDCESLLLEGGDQNTSKLKSIRRLGIGIALDDFGTGYSSLSYLARLPVSSLKIDRSFTAKMLDDPSIMTLVSTMITLAHSLNLKVIAEGVELEEQAKILRLLRCDQMQGYLISEPIPANAMTRYITG